MSSNNNNKIASITIDLTKEDAIKLFKVLEKLIKPKNSIFWACIVVSLLIVILAVYGVIHNNNAEHNKRQFNEINRIIESKYLIFNNTNQKVIDIRDIDQDLAKACVHHKIIDFYKMDLARAHAIVAIARVDTGIRYIFNSDVQDKFSQITNLAESYTVADLCDNNNNYLLYDKKMRILLHDANDLMFKSINEDEKKLREVGSTAKLPYTIMLKNIPI